ncbi:MAG: hypothetical protein MK110_16555 [Fuerstiella sp.]|nr:hypothetical protein [Fuerstiella sp.]
MLPMLYPVDHLYGFDRRNFLLAAGGTLTTPLARVLQAQPPAAASRRLLVNWDGSMIHCFGRAALGNPEGPLTREQFVSLVFRPLDQKAVDALFFSFGSGNVAEYQSNVLEWPGQADQLNFPEARTWHGGIEVDPADQYRNPRALADAGANPPAVVVEECHRRGLDAFVSLRMNDCHDGQHAKGVRPNPELPTFKRQNLDWLVPDLDMWSALNYAHPRVRALKLRVIEEFFDRWDFDGIELDWLRHTMHFPRGTEAENAHHLNTFMRQVRKSLRQRADKRGRPIEIAVRIPERVDWCLEGGFDIRTWIAEDLVDMLILGQGLTELPTLSEFRTLMTARQLPIYPCVTTYGNGYRIYPEDVVRGNAANLWRDGADGLSTFNWFFHGDWRRSLLGQIADPARLAGRDKRYVLVQRVEAPRREPGGDYVRFNTQSRAAPVPMNLNVGSVAEMAIPLADDASPGRSSISTAELCIGFEFSGESDELELTLNGQRLAVHHDDDRVEMGSVNQQIDIPAGQGLLGFPSTQSLDVSFAGLRIDVPPEFLEAGHNHLTMELRRRTPGIDHPLRVTRVELATYY